LLAEITSNFLQDFLLGKYLASPKNDSPRPFAVPQTVKSSSIKNDDAFGWKREKVPEIKEELKRLGLGAHRKEGRTRCSFRRASLHRAEPSRAE
jgi:hypothetical protein